MTVFWYDDIKVLFDKPDEFYPSYDMDLVEKLNAIARLSWYIGILLVLLTFNYLYLYIPVGIGLFTILIYKMQKDNVEKFFADYDRLTCGSEEPCTKPTTDNPFMNFNNITDDRFRAPACKSYDNEKIKEEIDDKFNYNLYRDVGDLYSKNNSQREFYTMPNTQVVNDQTSYAKWLYNTGSSSKEDTIKNAPEWSPVVTNQIFERLVNN